MQEVRLVVVDDETLFREGICGWLGTIPGFKVVGEARNSEECRAILESGAERPNIVLVDIFIPDECGFDIIRNIHDNYPDIRVAAISGSKENDHILEAFSAGACGFISKRTSPDELKLAIQTMIEGRSFLSSSLVSGIINCVLKEQQRIREYYPDADAGVLQETEKQCLKLIAEGFNMNTISKKLKVNIRTVERMRSRLFDKLGADSLSDLIRGAIKYGLIRP